jgi:hypothetical protein
VNVKDIDFSKLVSPSDIKGDDPEDTKLLRQQHQEACEYLLSWDGCPAVTESYFAGGVGGILSVSLLRIVPEDPDIEEYLWVVCGDIPSAFFTVEDGTTPRAVVLAYVARMMDWVNALEAGTSTDHLFPIDTLMTPELGRELKSRLEFIEELVLPRFA